MECINGLGNSTKESLTDIGKTKKKMKDKLSDMEFRLYI